MNISAPLDDLFAEVDKIQGWLDANRLIREALNALMNPLFDALGWEGGFVDMFKDAVTSKVLEELKPVITILDGFLSAINALIDAVQKILEYLTNPVGALVDDIY
jgi:hypothetical protein